MKSSGRLVLLAEDDACDVLLMREALKGSSACMRVEVSSDGPATLDRLRAAPRPDLLLLDWKLPFLSGADVLRAMRADAALKVVPAIVLTTSASDADVRLAYELGANAFLTKPTGLPALRRMLAAIEEFWCAHALLPPEASSEELSSQDNSPRDGLMLGSDVDSQRGRGPDR